MATTCSYCAGDATETCSACGKQICTDHAERALPYLSLKDMLVTSVRTLFTAPATLPSLLMDPGEEEVFCVDCHRVNSERRVQEQRKFFYLALGALAVCALAVYLIVRF
jgi:predicted nucleic acid-binding Zn ribbon protein